MENRTNPRAVKTFVKALFILALVWGSYLLLRMLIGRISTINGTVGAALVAGLVALFGYLFTQYQTKARDIAEAHRAHKVEVYEHLFDLIELMAIMAQEQPEGGEFVFPKSAAMTYRKFNRGVIAWGSPEVLFRWLDFKSRSQRGDQLEKLVLDMDAVLQAVRNDLGHSNFGLMSGDLMSLFFKNPEDIRRIR